VVAGWPWVGWMADAVEHVEGGSERRRYWTVDEKRRIVEQTLSSGLSVASLARQHGVNANQVFYWRKLYHAGQLGGGERSAESSVRLLPVSVGNDEPCAVQSEQGESAASSVSMNIEIPGRALVSLEGAVDANLVRAVIESLRG
jgi:transposase